jgi:hypothetical protein
MENQARRTRRRCLNDSLMQRNKRAIGNCRTLAATGCRAAMRAPD